MILFTLFVTSAFSQKKQTPAEREEAFRKEITRAKWQQIAKTDEGETYYINTLTMTRVVSTVIFTTMMEKRGTAEYNKVVGGCTKDLFAVSIRLQKNPGMSEFIGGEIEDPQMITVKKGTVGSAMLDYVCKNAAVTEVQ